MQKIHCEPFSKNEAMTVRGEYFANYGSCAESFLTKELFVPGLFSDASIFWLAGSYIVNPR